jgi:lipopolysaccharide export system permease protein
VAVIWPSLVMATILSVVTFEFYDSCATWGRPNLKRTLVESVDKIVYGILRSERSFRSDKFSINVKDVVGRKLIQPIIVLTPGKNRPPVTLTAAVAEIRTDLERRVLRIICWNGTLDVAGETKFWFTDREERVVPLEDTTHARPSELSPAALAIVEIPKQVEHEKKALAVMHARRTQRQQRGESERPGLIREFKRRQFRLWRLQTEPYRRWSNGFNCLSFALIGIAVAMRQRLSDNLTIFFLCFLPILLLFYPLLVLGEYIATKGLLPPSSVWLPNIVLIVLACLAMRRVIRY